MLMLWGAMMNDIVVLLFVASIILLCLGVIVGSLTDRRGIAGTLVVAGCLVWIATVMKAIF